MGMERERRKAAGEKEYSARGEKKIAEDLWILGKCFTAAGIYKIVKLY